MFVSMFLGRQQTYAVRCRGADISLSMLVSLVTIDFQISQGSKVLWYNLLSLRCRTCAQRLPYTY